MSHYRQPHEYRPGQFETLSRFYMAEHLLIVHGLMDDRSAEVAAASAGAGLIDIHDREHGVTRAPIALLRAWCQSTRTGTDVGDTLTLRTARIAHRCHARLCAYGHEPIKAGERYIEYGGEAPAYQSGSGYHLRCAANEWVNFLYPVAADLAQPAEWQPDETRPGRELVGVRP